MHDHDQFDFIVLTPAGKPDPNLAIAGSRAGAIGVLNLEHTADVDASFRAYTALNQFGHGRTGIQICERSLSILELLPAPDLRFPSVVIIASIDPAVQAPAIERVHRHGSRAFVVVSDLDAALNAQHSGADGVIARGHEAGGWVGDETSFVLLQRLVSALEVPVWVQGGIGLHSAAAAAVGGAAGAVLDSQVLLTRESPLPPDIRTRIASMDGSETICLGASLGAAFRSYSRPGLEALDAIQQAMTGLMVNGEAPKRAAKWRDEVNSRVGWENVTGQLLAIGQDAAFAAPLADRYLTVGGVLNGYRDALESHLETAAASLVLGENASLAKSHGTRFPIVQGPMTRVSDRAAFAESVASAGALPFVALALMRGPDIRDLLNETAQRLGDRPWGVGILGFVPPELRAEQLDVIRDTRPPFALIAGGRSDQARMLEDEGITTYLHVPSPGLLRIYLQDGARRFIFEGRECGGHVGPRTSFVLWDTMVEVLLNDLPKGVDPATIHVLFAGGIHDGRSAAMMSALAAPLAAKGIKVGALIGSAYLFTDEAVASGAITQTFQQAAIDCQQTVLLESGPGHATRCVPSPFADDFDREKRRLLQNSLSADEVRNRLEELNIGRLRIASKGVDRNPAFTQDQSLPKLIEVEPADQWTQGMYMIGQVAALRSETCGMEELHRQICDGAVNVLSQSAQPAERTNPEVRPPCDIAIVGIGCIVPGAPDLSSFWVNVLNKVDAITEIPPKRWDWRQYYDPDRNAKDKVYSRWGGFIDDVPFDPVEFGMPPSSLKSIEPFQLLALLVVRAALEDAGLMKRPFPRERTSVMLGAGGGGGDLSGNYVVRSSLPNLFGESAGDLVEDLGDTLPEWTEDSFAGILMNVAAGRVANRFDFGGLNYTVDAACASSLAAIYLAVRDLESGNSDVAIAGGIDAIQNPFAFLCFAKTQALSPSGRCRPFDAGADGIAISEGFATVVMKRLADAERDGDRIYAVIRGVGGASDGRDRSLTAPRPEGQMRALRRAYAQAGFSPATVGVIEAHGTGTVAGDQAEVEALSRFFTEFGAERQGTAIGSVKSMIGHTKAAAGVAGLIKMSLSLYHGVLPPTIGVTQPNPKANFAESPLYVNTEARPWPRHPSGYPRRAGVSAFGFGGTDFHIALEEYTGSYLPEQRVAVETWPAELFVWKADSRSKVLNDVKKVLEPLELGAKPKLADLAFSLAAEAEGRTGDVTLAIVADSVEDLILKLKGVPELLAGEGERHHLPSGVHFADRPLAREGKVAFLFPGQGSQYVDMCRDLAVMFPEVRDCFERADAAIAEHFDRPLSRFVFPPPTFSADEARDRQSELTETNIAQPALGAAGVAMLRLLRRFGVTPEMAAGHSYGEFVALHSAGCFDEATLLRLSEARGRFMREGAGADAGTMAAIDAGVEDLTPLAGEFGVVLANLNAPRQTVISGSEEAVDRAVTWCTEHGLRARRLPVACAFHSPLVEPAQKRLQEMLARTNLSAPAFPVFSNTTGQAHANDPGEIAATLGDHLIRPVLWRDEVSNMYDAGGRIFVEVGPKSVLSGLVGQILDNWPHVRVVLDQPKRNGVTLFLHGLAALVSEGVDVRVTEFFAGRPVQKIDLPSLSNQPSGPRRSATTWLVNGGRAIPASQAVHAEPKQPVLVRALSRPEIKSHSTVGGNVVTAQNGSYATGAANDPGAGSHSSSWDTGPARNLPRSFLKGKGGGFAMTSTRDLPAEVTLDGDQALARGPGRPPSGESDDVMAMFQHVMQQFLDTQRSVMLAYLGQGPGPQRRSTPRPLATARPVAEPRITPNGHANGSVPTVAPVHTEPFHPTGPATNGNGFKQTTNGREHHEVPPVRTPEPQREVEQSRQIETVAPAEASVASTMADVPTRDTLLEMLLKVVSDRTGYPTEMLGLDADLEADLGIDSIKRVEISGTIVQSLTLPPGVSPDLERLTSSRTLNQVVDTLVDMLSSAATTTSAEEGTRPFDSAPAGERIGRFLLSTTHAPLANSSAALARDGVVVIVDDERGVGARLASEIAGRGHRAVRITQETSPSGADNTLVADLQQPAELRRAVDDIRKRFGRVAALVHLPSLAATNRPDDLDVEGWHAWRARTLHSLLTLSQSLRQDLEESSAQGGSAVLVATSLGGAFGTTRPAIPGRVPDGGLSGFAKTLAQEWPSVRVRAVDFDTDEQDTLVETLLSELFSDDNVAEVAYVGGKRLRISLVPATTSESDNDPLNKDSVVVITGGARGITAEVAQTLAARYRSTFVLIGRTPAPSENEPDYAKGVVDRNELRKAVLAYLKSTGASPAVADVEREVNRIVGEREVRENLARIGVFAVRVDYRSCDVRNAAQFSALIDDIYDEFGRIDGVIHGAGIIEDKLVKDKQLDSFERVISTKVDSALTLARTLRPESLRFLVLFSSVSGRFGNRGQADYAAANEMLNKLAVSLDANWPGRVVSVNWGPWLKTGMVSPEVQRQFAERQVTLIPLPVGCQMLDYELRSGRKGEAEVVIGGTGNPEAMAAITRSERRSTPGESHSPLPLLGLNAKIESREKSSAVVSRIFDVAVDRYLDDHRLDGRPVLPFAFASELMAEAAATAFPNLTVSEVRDIRLLNGLTFDQNVKSVLVTARIDEREASQSETWSDVSVAITSPVSPARVHYRSTVRLSRGPAPLAIDAPLAPLGEAASFPMPVEDVYREWLFHGPVFQRIVSIDRIGPTGASAWLLPSTPSEGSYPSAGGAWLVDPILVDGAFQMQVVWARMHWDVTLLPAEVGSIHRFGPIDPNDGPVRYELRIRKESSAPLCHADHYFFDRRGTLVGWLQDVVGAGSRELNRLAGSAR